MLAYDLTSNEAEWIPVQGMASDLSQVEEASAKELSNMVPHDTIEGVQRLDRFREQRSKSGDGGMEGSDAEESTVEAPHKACMDQGYDQLTKMRVTALSMAHAPQHLARGACTPRTATTWDPTPVVSVGRPVPV